MKAGLLYLKSASLAGDGMRFLVAGGLNTLLTLVVYQALLLVMPYPAAYAVAWVTGLLFVMIVYPSRVFPEGRSRLADRLALGASYIVVFLCGLAVLEALTRAGIPPRLGIFLVMIVSTAVNFVAGRLLLRRTQED